MLHFAHWLSSFGSYDAHNKKALSLKEINRSAFLRERELFVRGPNATFKSNWDSLGHSLLQVIRFSPVAIILPLLHTNYLIHVALTRIRNGRNLGTFQKSSAVSEIGGHWMENYFHLFKLKFWCRAGIRGGGLVNTVTNHGAK
jgi:hypothetical protein